MNKKDKKTDKTIELEQKISELKAGWQRTQADFINYKKQAAEEKAKYCRAANADLIYELLPVLDNFALAAKHLPEDLKENNWAQGIKQIERQLEDILASVGLEKIESLDQEFNPALHEAVEHKASEKPEDIIIEEILPGFKFDGEVLRPAKVIVSAGKKPKE